MHRHSKLTLLFCSRHFLPELGGIPIVTDLLCRYLQLQGFTVSVVTETQGECSEVLPYPVFRRISPYRIQKMMREADCVIMQHLCIRHLLPLWVSRAKSLTVLHSRLETWTVRDALFSILFKTHVHFAKNVAAVSEALRSEEQGCKFTLVNPYDNALFNKNNRQSDAPLENLIFLGRLVSVKGVEFCVEALSILRKHGRNCMLTIVGDGPSRAKLEQQTRDFQLEPYVTFEGSKHPWELPDLLYQNGIILIPSVYFEAFGLIAIEAIACSLYVVAFRRGGLPEAVGEAGLLCDEKSAVGLASKIEELLDNEALRIRLRSNREKHLARFHVEAAGNEYRKTLERIICAS